MKYKVGDRVKIKSWDEMAEEYGVHRDETGMQYIDTPGYRFIEDMEIYCGNTMVIQYICNNDYMMIETGYIWTDEMIDRLADRLPEDAKYDDLEPDMIVIYMSGYKRLVAMINGEKCFIEDDFSVIDCHAYLPLKDDHVKRVIRIKKVGIGRSVFSPASFDIVWEKQKEMTMEEAEEKLTEIFQMPVRIKINS